MKRRPTRRTKAGKAALQEFRDRWYGQPCWLCPIRLGQHIHHIVHRRGVAYDDRRNLAWLCPICHARLHDGPQVLYRVELEAWTDADVLLAKKVIEPGWWDLGFLRELDGRLNDGEGM